MGGDGKQAKNIVADNKGIQLLQGQAGAASDPRLLDIMGKYSRGEMKLQDALKSTGADHSARKSELQQSIAKFKKLQDMGIDVNDTIEVAPQIASWERELNDLGNDEMQNRTRQHQLFTDPTTGTLAATDQVKNNDLFKGVFGEGGLNDRILSEEQDLAKRGFSLQPEDYEAYGQASNETARMFGQEENSLAQALAARGLSAAPSGAAGVAFSGLMGNKHERLASAQRKIADDRMKMNLERLNSARNFAMEGNKLAQAAVGDQFARNRQGVNDYNNTLKDSANAARMAQEQENVGFEQVEATRGPTFGEFMGDLGSMALGNFGGGLGKAAGSSLGERLTKK
jgi:hypothetical protein